MTRADARLVSNGLLIVAGAALVVAVGREVWRRPRWVRVARRIVWRAAPCLLAGTSPARLAAIATAAVLDAASDDARASAASAEPQPSARTGDLPRS